MRGLVLACLAVAAACSRDVPIGDPPLPGVAVIDGLLAAELRIAVVAKGPAYRPHTRHLAPSGSALYTNRLILETSPYLLQHAHNPVSWYAWGEAAFERARREHKLVLLSIGYSTCHWCHVMEVESFEDDEVARYLNANYICIKVDREERPDLDAVYMDAVMAMTGNGGWPMTVVTDPERKPVFGTSYLRKPQLLAVLGQLRGLLETDPARLADIATQLVISLARDEGPSGAMPGPEVIARGAAGLAAVFDPQWGGFGEGTKFPSPPELELLLRYHRRTTDPYALEMVTRTLDAIAAGGIHDHLAGGFHRYTTDRQWLVPHFEKMLYDNAQLAVVYMEAWQITGRADYAEIARSTLDYVVREMTAPDGGFYSATDADSPAPDGRSVEGYFFTWTADEIDAVVGAEGSIVRPWFGIGSSAQVAGRSILHTPRALADVAATLNVSPEQLRARLETARIALLAARAHRAPPARDDKILTAWNGLMISALARGGFAFDRADYVAAAARAATFVLARLRTADGGLRRSWRAGEARQAGTLEDYAFLIAALLDLFEATAEPTWLATAADLARQLDHRFGDPTGGYVMTDPAAERLLVKIKPTDDGVAPSGNAIAIVDLLRLAELTDDQAWRARAVRALGLFGPVLARDQGVPALRSALDQALDTPLEVVIVAPREIGEAGPLLAEVRHAYLPGRALAVTTTAAAPALGAAVPMVAGKRAIGGVPTAFVCERGRCRQPTTQPAELAAQLARVQPLLPDRTPQPLR